MRLTISFLVLFCFVSSAIAWSLERDIVEDDRLAVENEDELDDFEFDFEDDDEDRFDLEDDEDELEERGWKERKEAKKNKEGGSKGKWGKKKKEGEGEKKKGGWGKKKNDDGLTKKEREALEKQEYEDFVAAFAAGNVTRYKPTGKTLKKIAGRVHAIYKRDRNFGAESIRLSFHDCAGGCDGCLDLNDKNNFGLETAVNKLQAMYKKQKYIYRHLSFADFIAFAGKTNIKYSIRKNNNMCNNLGCPKMPKNSITFRTGRVDCGPEPNVPRPNDVFPAPDMRSDEVFLYFKENFDMDEEQVTVLLGGVHSLGRAQIKNSGFDGAFRIAADGNTTMWAFNNGPFIRLTDGKNEFRVEADDPDSDEDKKFKFGIYDEEGNRIGMMFPSDVSLAYQIDGSKTEPPTCKINEKSGSGDLCPRSENYEVVEVFAQTEKQDINNFMEKFSNAFTKMTENAVFAEVYEQPQEPEEPEASEASEASG